MDQSNNYDFLKHKSNFRIFELCRWSFVGDNGRRKIESSETFND